MFFFFSLFLSFSFTLFACLILLATEFWFVYHFANKIFRIINYVSSLERRRRKRRSSSSMMIHSMQWISNKHENRAQIKTIANTTKCEMFYNEEIWQFSLNVFFFFFGFHAIFPLHGVSDSGNWKYWCIQFSFRYISFQHTQSHDTNNLSKNLPFKLINNKQETTKKNGIYTP